MLLRSATVLLLVIGPLAQAQTCPKSDPKGPSIPSAVQTIRGTLTYHNGVRQWYELTPEKPVCGERSIEEVGTGWDDQKAVATWRALERMRGCVVEATGSLAISGTGYYSLDLYQPAEHLQPVGICALQPLLPDYSTVKPAKWVKAYSVTMDVNYSVGDHPIGFTVTSGARVLSPPQAYASYELTGGFVLYGRCGDGFHVTRVWGTRQAHPSFWSTEEPASFDPESAAAAGVHRLHLGYRCAVDR